MRIRVVFESLAGCSMYSRFLSFLVGGNGDLAVSAVVVAGAARFFGEKVGWRRWPLFWLG